MLPAGDRENAPHALLRAGFLFVFLLAAHATVACESQQPRDVPPPTVQRVEPRPLEATFLTRALSSLDKHLSKDARLLEIRATQASVEVQLVVDEGIQMVRYHEVPPTPDDEGAGLAPPVAQVDTPIQIPVYGNGDLNSNAFAPSEVKLDRITHAFPVAIKAVDPADGWIRELVVRRNLPFGQAVRARIYVESPRMSGSIDTNSNGIPLKR